MRVVHLCKAFSKRSETFIYDYVTELERQGLDNYVLANRRVNAEERPFGKVTVVPWPSVWNPRRVGQRLLEVLQVDGGGASWRARWPGAAEAAETQAPDVLHAHFGRLGVKAVPIAQQLGCPLVVTFYGYDISQLPRQARWRTAYRAIWQHAGAVVVLSEEMKAQAVRLGAPADRVRVIHLARDLDAFAYRAPKPPVTHWISVGRLTEKKGHLDAIRAVERVRRQGTDIRLQIIGEGPQRQALERSIQQHGLESVVELLGTRPNAEVAARLQASDAFLLCSKTASSGDREGTPTVLIEAQAVGLPCVSTRHAGIPEMIPPVNHRFLAPEGDVDAIAMCIRTMQACSAEELRRCAAAGRAQIEAAFSLTEEARKLHALYERVRAGRPVSGD